MNWRKLLKYLTLGLVVVASRSAKVRRVKGKIDNCLELIREIEAMARESGTNPLPFEDVRREFDLSYAEATKLVQLFNATSRSYAIVDSPEDVSTAGA